MNCLYSFFLSKKVFLPIVSQIRKKEAAGQFWELPCHKFFGVFRGGPRHLRLSFVRKQNQRGRSKRLRLLKRRRQKCTV